MKRDPQINEKMESSDKLERLTNFKSSRFDAFTDGVFAIVATLLVITFDVPLDIPKDQVHTLLPARLLDMWPHYISYILSFIVVGVYWVTHYIIIHLIKYLNRVALWLNLTFLMVIAFIPFPTDLMSEYRHHFIPVVFYGIIQVITSGLLASIWIYSAHMNAYYIEELPSITRNRITKAVLLAPFMNLVAIAFAFCDPKISLFLFLTVPAIYVFNIRQD